MRALLTSGMAIALGVAAAAPALSIDQAHREAAEAERGPTYEGVVEGIVLVTAADRHVPRSASEAVVYLLDTPCFTRPAESGSFRITGLPHGRHRVVAWHESAGADTVEVVVGASGKATAHLRLPS